MSTATPPTKGSGIGSDADEISVEEFSRRMRLVSRFRRERNRSRPVPTYRGDPALNHQWVEVDPSIWVNYQLAEVNRQLAEVKEYISALATVGESSHRAGSVAESAMHPKANVRGIDVAPKMLNLLSSNVRCAEWSSVDWARRLGCSPSTVRGTRVWREHLPKLRKALAEERTHKMDRMRLVRPGRPLPDQDTTED